jgi:hypothetical protein
VKRFVFFQADTTILVYKKEKRQIKQYKSLGCNCMPLSKKELEKKNKAKKAKAEELSKQAAAGSEAAKKKLKKLNKKID